MPEPPSSFVLKRKVETCDRAVGPEGPRPVEHAAREATEVREAVDAAVGSYGLTASKEAAVGPELPSLCDCGVNTEGVTPGIVPAALLVLYVRSMSACSLWSCRWPFPLDTNLVQLCRPG